MTDPAVQSWTERFWKELPDEIRFHRAETMWRTFAPNRLDMLIGETIADLGATRGMLSIATTEEWLTVSELIENLLEREPLSKGPHYSGERLILATFANELKAYAAAADRSHDA